MEKEIENVRKEFQNETGKECKNYYLEGDGIVWDSYNAEYTEWLEKRMVSLFPKWISVDEIEPPKKTKVIVFCGDGSISSNSWGEGVFKERHFAHGKDWINWDDNSFGVTHWMPLPQPPKTEE